MSGHRLRRGPHHRAKAWRWGPAGWYCCGNRLMAAGAIQNGAPIHVCHHCGTVIAVAGEEILNEERPGRPAAQPPQGEQLTFDVC